jgi:hypothetical protein
VRRLDQTAALVASYASDRIIPTVPERRAARVLLRLLPLCCTNPENRQVTVRCTLMRSRPRVTCRTSELLL